MNVLEIAPWVAPLILVAIMGMGAVGWWLAGVAKDTEHRRQQ